MGQEVKACGKCGSRDRFASGGCRPCNISRKAKWYAENRERARAQCAKWHAKNREKERERAKRWRTENVNKRMLNDARRRARKFGRPFNIEESDVVIPHVCPVLGIPLVRKVGQGYGAWGNSPSVDCIVPELGYVKGNVWVISHRANAIKSDASPEEIFAVAAAVRSEMTRIELAKLFSSSPPTSDLGS